MATVPLATVFKQFLRGYSELRRLCIVRHQQREKQRSFPKVYFIVACDCLYSSRMIKAKRHNIWVSSPTRVPAQATSTAEKTNSIHPDASSTHF